MSFAHPLALLLLLLLIPVGLLYWLRLHVPRVVVGTGLFWQKALAEEPFRARWQRWRTAVSLVLHALTVVLLALAAAGPEIPPPQRIVLILDNSATMRATDVQPTRFDAAKDAARRMIDSLRWCDEMAIVVTNSEQLYAYGPGIKLLHFPEESQRFTSDRTLLRAAIDSAQPVPEPPEIQGALKVARKVAHWNHTLLSVGPNSGVVLTPETHPSDPAPSCIVLITDGYASGAVREARESGAEVLRVGAAAGNRALTCFTARRSKIDPRQCEVFVEVQNHSDQTAQGNLELSIDGKPGPTVPFAIEKDRRWQHLFDKLSLPGAARLTARITPGDAYPFDDTAELHIPAVPSPKRSGLIARPSIPHLGDGRLQSGIEGGLAALYRGIMLDEAHRAAPNSPMFYAEFLGPLYGEPNGVDIRVRDAGSDAGAFPSVPPPTRGAGAPPPWLLLAAVAAVFVVLEWCLYLRRWTG